MTVRMLAQVATPRPGARHTGKQADQVTRDSSQPFALLQLLPYIRQQSVDDFASIRQFEPGIHVLFEFSEKIWMVVGLPANHDAINVIERFIDMSDLGNPSIEDNLELGI